VSIHRIVFNAAAAFSLLRRARNRASTRRSRELHRHSDIHAMLAEAEMEEHDIDDMLDAIVAHDE
jgi:hypothetical protein